MHCPYVPFGCLNFTQFPDVSVTDRLRTIIGYDRICVLDAGQIAEFDTPANLFNTPGGIFRSMCDRSSISLSDIKQAEKAKEAE